MSYIFKTVLHGERVIRGKKHPGKSLSRPTSYREYGIMSFLSRARARKPAYFSRARARKKLKNKNEFPQHISNQYITLCHLTLFNAHLCSKQG